MPTNIRSNLITHSGTLNEISLLADNMLEFNYNNMSSYVNHPMQFNPSSSHVNSVHQNSYNNRPNYRNNPSHYNSSTSNYNGNQYNNQNHISNLASDDVPMRVRSFNGKQKPKVCRFHIYYGHQAKRCKP